MAAMFRRLTSLASAALLLLSILSTGLWVRSYWRVDALSWERGVATAETPKCHSIYLRSSNGRVSLYRRWGEDESTQGGFLYLTGPDPDPDLLPQAVMVYDDPEQYGTTDWTRLGVRHSFCGTQRHGCDVTMIPWAYAAVPLWALAAIALVPIVRRRLRGRRKGFCPACGYDVRATPSLCPECGTVSNRIVP